MSAQLQGKIIVVLALFCIYNEKKQGGISRRVASPTANDCSGITAACRNGNNQEVLRIRQQTQLTPSQNLLQSQGISTSRPVTASSPQADNIAQNSSVGSLQRELQFCEAVTSDLGEPDTTEEMRDPCSASRSQNNPQTSHSESFLMKGPVESSSTLPLRQATVPSCVSGGNYTCRRNQGLKRSSQQSSYTKIVSTAQQPARVSYATPSTPTACQPPIHRIERNTSQDVPNEILPTPSIKRKRTVSHYGPHEQEQFGANICMQSLGTKVARQSLYETQSVTRTVHSEGSQIQRSSQFDVSLQRQDGKAEVIATQVPTENHSSFEPLHQLPLQRRQKESPVQICTHVQSQERMQISQSLLDRQPPSQITPDSQLPSHKASTSQLPFLRMPQSRLQYRRALKLHREPQSSLPLQPLGQPQSSHAVPSQTNMHNNLQLQNQEVIRHCNPFLSCSTAKLILASGKKIKKKFKLLHSHPRMPYMTSVLHSSECPQGNEVQRPVNSFANSRCTNRSVQDETENSETEEHSQTVLESGNATCVVRNGSETEFIGDVGGLLEEEPSSLADLNTERSVGRWGAHQFSKPVAHTSDSCLCEDSSSHTFNNFLGYITSSGNDAENNIQRERVPGQIFSRLGVKVELVSVDNNVCNTPVKTDALPSCRFGSSVSYKINKLKKHTSLPNKFAKIMAVKQLPKNKLLKRKIVFRAFQKASAGRQNIVQDQTPQEVRSLHCGQPKLRGILKPQTITSKQQEDMESPEKEHSQKMTANVLLESVTRTDTTHLGMVSDAVNNEENSLSNDSTKSEDGNYIYQNTGNFCNDDEQQGVLNRAPTSGTCKTVRFGPVCIQEFEKNVVPLSGKTPVISRGPIFSRLGARRKEI